MQKGLDEENFFVSQSVLIRRYQFFGAVIEVSNMVERRVHKYEM